MAAVIFGNVIRMGFQIRHCILNSTPDSCRFDHLYVVMFISCGDCITDRYVQILAEEPDGKSLVDACRYDLKICGIGMKCIQASCIPGSNQFFKVVDLIRIIIIHSEYFTGILRQSTSDIADNMDGDILDQWTSGKKAHRLKLPSGTYTLTETTSPFGYAKSETVSFEVKKRKEGDYEVTKVEMLDAPIRVQITKSDITDGKPVAGAGLEIHDADGRLIEKWTTTKKPHTIEKLPAGKYTLTETTAPEGYETAESVAFTVKDTGEIQKVEMKDAPLRDVDISKSEITTGKELPGAKLIIKDEQGKEVESWTSTKEPHMIEKLPVGKYTLTEVTAPKGYDIAETVAFEVTDSAEIVHVKMMDKPKDELVDLTGKKKETTPGGYTVGTPGTPGTPVTSVTAAPVKTGDYNRYLPAILLIVCGAAGLAGVAFGRRKKKLTDK